MQAARNRQIGVTLVECCIAMTVVVVALGAALPSFQQMLTKRTVEGVAGELETDLMYVRSEAVSRNQNLSISFGSAGNGCYVIHTGGPADCSCSANVATACAAGVESIKTVVLPAAGQVRLQPNVASMRFNPEHGTATPAATLRVVASSGLEIRQIVNIMGRPRACSVGGKIAGYKACA
jgi:type IV fimbrial biogenesis protein FimT